MESCYLSFQFLVFSCRPFGIRHPKDTGALNRMQNYQVRLQYPLLYLSNVFQFVAYHTNTYIILIQICNIIFDYQYFIKTQLLLTYYVLNICRANQICLYSPFPITRYSDGVIPVYRLKRVEKCDWALKPNE